MNKRAKVKTQKHKIELRVIPKAKKQITISFSGAQKASPAEEYVTTPYISNKVGNISALKKFVISSFPAPWSPVVLTAIYLRP